MLTLRRILFPNDHSACAGVAFLHALDLARTHGAELHMLHVRPPARPGAPDCPAAAHPTCLDAAARAGVRLVQVEERAPRPALGILTYARAWRADLLVMGTHGRQGLDRLLLGSVAEEVVRRADCPVLTVRPDAVQTPHALRRVLAPVDFSPSSWLAVAYAEHLAALSGAQLDLLHVVETLPTYGLVDIPPAFPPPSGEVEAEAHEALRDLAREAGGPRPALATHVLAGHPTIGVLQAAASLCPDLIVLPTHGRSGLKRLVLGSVAEQVVRRATCPVLVVRGEGRGLLPPALGDGAPTEAPFPVLAS